MNGARITEEEAAVYDRQIRVWGLDAQKRLRAANVLVIGCDGLTGEVLKNIVLAGVNSVTIYDDSEVMESCLESIFFVNKEHIGKPIASVVAEGLRKLNPLVSVASEIKSLFHLDAEYLKGFHVVCISNTSIPLLEKFGEICRKHEIKFYCGSVFGFYGYLFADLGRHEYAQQEKVDEEVVSDEPHAKKSKTEKYVTIKRTCDFESFSSAMQVKLNQLTPKQLKKLPQDYFIMRVLLDYCTKHGHKPSECDVDAVRSQVKDTMQSLELDDSLIDEKFLLLACRTEMSPVCAIVGGILAQEILTAVSLQNAPINNYFFFNPERCAGYRETIGSNQPLAEPPKVIAEVDVLD